MQLQRSIGSETGHVSAKSNQGFNSLGAWCPGAESPAFNSDELLNLVNRIREPIAILRDPQSGHIGAGIGGTAMPAWKGSLSEDDLWSLALYVQSVYALKDTKDGTALRKALENQPAFVAPTADPAAAEGEAPAEK